MIIASIDPGTNGGMAYLLNGAVVSCSMPDTEGDILELLVSINKVATIEKLGTPTVFIEQVGGFIGRPQPGSAMFKFGRNYGFCLGVCMALAWRIELVTPQKWQKELGLGKSEGDKTAWKNKLKSAAQRLYPDQKVTLLTADALLILEYGRKAK